MTQHRAPRASGRLRRAGRETVLTLGAVLGVICLVAAVVGIAFDVRPVIFRSGSMSPAIETGALALSRTVPAADLAVGDVVTVEDAKGALVTHRVRSVTMTGDDATLILKGDDNPVADPEPYVVQSVDRVFADVPRLGYVVSFLSGPVGIFAGGLLVGLVLTTVFARRRQVDDASESVVPDTMAELDEDVPAEIAEESAPGTALGGKGKRRKLVLAAVVVVGAVGLLSATTTNAAWVDQAGVSTGTFTMRQAPVVAPTAPSITACARAGNAIQLTITRSTLATSYRVEYTNPGGPETFAAPVGVGPFTYSTLNANFNNSTGTIRVFAINAVGTSESNVYSYSGNGTNGICVPA